MLEIWYVSILGESQVFVWSKSMKIAVIRITNGLDYYKKKWAVIVWWRWNSEKRKEILSLTFYTDKNMIYSLVHRVHDKIMWSNSSWAN